jgi:hypothetical protein
MGWLHQHENTVSHGVVSCDLDFEGQPTRIWLCNFARINQSGWATCQIS